MFQPFEKSDVSPKLKITLPSEAVVEVLDCAVVSLVAVRLRLAVAVPDTVTVSPIRRGVLGI